MDNKTCKTMEIVFFGAGKIGRYWLECCRELGIIPKGMLDNDRSLCGTLCEGVRVYHTDDLQMLSFETVFITCGREEEIYWQLLALGVAESKILIGGYNIFNHLLYYAVSSNVLSGHMYPACLRLGHACMDRASAGGVCSGQTDCRETKLLKTSSRERKILFDLRNGMVLGGVESWVYGLAKELRENGYQGLYLASDAEGPKVMDKTFPVQVLAYKNLHQEKDRVKLCVDRMSENLPCTIICNFPQNIFWSACVIKKLFPDQVRIVAVQHSDEQIYYETYSLWQEYIDRCLVISSHIKKKLLTFGMQMNKLGHLGWKVVCEKSLNRTWSTDEVCLQIGYAGRVTAIQKRVDLLLVLAAKLRKKGIRFQMNIAGDGDYYEILQEKIKEDGLQEYITLVGYIDRKEIPLFWIKQDIMVSCSEWEGHSISQSEAMAGGAVPILTNVSGAKDDVMDGYNGYIVEIGDMDGLADRIFSLCYDRDKLKQMGRNAYETIYQRQIHMDQAEFWAELLEEVWRE